MKHIIFFVSYKLKCILWKMYSVLGIKKNVEVDNKLVLKNVAYLLIISEKLWNKWRLQNLEKKLQKILIEAL